MPDYYATFGEQEAFYFDESNAEFDDEGLDSEAIESIINRVD